MELVSDIVKVFEHYKFASQVIAAKAGAHIATVPYRVLMQMIQHLLTTSGISRFAEDWR